MLVVPNVGEVLQINALLGKTAPAVPFTLRLFTNNHIPASTDVTGDYVEAAGGGYAAINLNPASWVTTPGAPAVSLQPEQVFTFSGALTGPAAIFGYYVTDDDLVLLWAERRTAGAFTPAGAGDFYAVTPRFTLGSESDD